VVHKLSRKLQQRDKLRSIWSLCICQQQRRYLQDRKRDSAKPEEVIVYSKAAVDSTERIMHWWECKYYVLKTVRTVFEI
jgi:hypothetical protein